MMFCLNVEWAILFLTSVLVLRHLGATGLAAAYLIADSLRLGTALMFLTGRRPALAVPAVDESSLVARHAQY